MATVQKSLRIPSEITKAIEEVAEASGRDFSTVANELITDRSSPSTGSGQTRRRSGAVEERVLPLICDS